jgi:hypothetical protein
MGILIKPDGSKEQIEPASGKYFTLEEMQGYVGGYIEKIYDRSGRIIIGNEEGKLHNLPVNSVATNMWAPVNESFDVLVGNILFLNPEEWDTN